MSTFHTILPYLKLLFVFATMLTAIRFKLGLGWSMLGGSFLLALCFGVDPLQWFQAGISIFSDSTILTVWIILALILCMSSIMEKNGQAERFMGALSHRITSPSARLVFFPILIGLLPMPGGAVFSAPLINAVARDFDLPEVDKSLINYWFRHTAEMSWPLFPGIILAAGIAGVPTIRLVLVTGPLVLVFYVAGWWFFMRKLKFPPGPGVVSSKEEGSWSNILYQGLPIIVAIGGALIFEALIAFTLPSVPMDYGVVPALCLAIAVSLKQNGKTFKDFVDALRGPQVAPIIFMVGAIGVFKNVLGAGGIVQSLQISGDGLLALSLAAVFLPMLVGALTGILMACVGATFPLLVAVLASMGITGEQIMPWIALATFSAFSGTMGSPLHICFVLSCEYFKVTMPESWRRLPGPVAFFWLGGFLYFMMIK